MDMNSCSSVKLSGRSRYQYKTYEIMLKRMMNASIPADTLSWSGKYSRALWKLLSWMQKLNMILGIEKKTLIMKMRLKTKENHFYDFLNFLLISDEMIYSRISLYLLLRRPMTTKTSAKVMISRYMVLKLEMNSFSRLRVRR